jgi:hypothetical protein
VDGAGAEEGEESMPPFGIATVSLRPTPCRKHSEVKGVSASFIEEIRGDEPALAKSLRIEERELEAGGWN